MLNKTVLVGRLTRDPELRYTQDGVAVASFNLAVQRRYNREQTDFIDIVTWRKLAELCAEYLRKGRLVSVEGSIKTETYTDKNGQKRKSFQVVANDVRFLDKNKPSESSGKAKKDDWSDIATEFEAEVDNLNYEEDDEIPF